MPKSFEINSSKYFRKCKNFEKFNIFPKVKIQYLNNVGVKSTHPNVHTLCRGYHICLDFKPEPGQLQYCSELCERIHGQIETNKRSSSQKE